MFCSNGTHTQWWIVDSAVKITSANQHYLPLWLRLQSTKQILKRKAFSGFQVCVGISCVRLTRERLHTQSVRWPVLQPISSGLDYNSKSFHITAISALHMAVRSRNLNPHSTAGIHSETNLIFNKSLNLITLHAFKDMCIGPKLTQKTFLSHILHICSVLC